MKNIITFCGASGAQHIFTKAKSGNAWVQNTGVAVFAAPDAYGWRVIRVVELSGRPHDVRPIWALHDAERYGASAVFIAENSDFAARRGVIEDLEAGLSPVVVGGSIQQGLPMAA